MGELIGPRRQCDRCGATGTGKPHPVICTVRDEVDWTRVRNVKTGEVLAEGWFCVTCMTAVYSAAFKGERL